DVIQLQTDLRSCFGTAGLLRRASREHADDLRAERGEYSVYRAAESRTVRQQQHDGSNAPGHAQHGEHGAAAIVLHRSVGLSEEVFEHSYSLRSASTGSSIAAFRAG